MPRKKRGYIQKKRNNFLVQETVQEEHQREENKKIVLFTNPEKSKEEDKKTEEKSQRRIEHLKRVKLVLDNWKKQYGKIYIGGNVAVSIKDVCCDLGRIDEYCNGMTHNLIQGKVIGMESVGKSDPSYDAEYDLYEDTDSPDELWDRGSDFMVKVDAGHVRFYNVVLGVKRFFSKKILHRFYNGHFYLRFRYDNLGFEVFGETFVKHLEPTENFYAFHEYMHLCKDTYLHACMYKPKRTKQCWTYKKHNKCKNRTIGHTINYKHTPEQFRRYDKNEDAFVFVCK